MIAARRAEAVDTEELETLRSRIRARMKEIGISGNEVSRRAKVGISYVNDLLSGQSKRPEIMKIARVADVLNCDLEYLLGEQNKVRSERERAAVSQGGPGVVALGAARRPVGEASRIPLYASPWPDEAGFFAMSEAPDEMTTLPFEGVAGAYAVMVPDDRMSPRYAIGEKVFANPRRPIVPGAFVVVRLKDGRAIIRQVDAIEPKVALSDLRDKAVTTLDRDQIAAIHRITASSEG